MVDPSKDEVVPPLQMETARTTLDQMRVQMQMEETRETSFNTRAVALDALIGGLVTGLVIASRSLIVVAGPLSLRILTCVGLALTVATLGMGFRAVTNGVLRTGMGLRLDADTLKLFTRRSWLSREPERAAASLISTYQVVIERAHQRNETKALSLNRGYRTLGVALVIFVATAVPAIVHAIIWP